MHNNLLFFALFTFILAGCQVKEKITPSFKVEKLEESINTRPLTFHIPISPIEGGYSEFDELSEIEGPIGRTFARFAGMLADQQVDIDDETAIKRMGPFSFEFEELKEVDFDYIRDIFIQNVEFRMDDRFKSDEEVNFNFLNYLEIYIRFDDEVISTAPPPPSALEVETAEKASVDDEGHNNQVFESETQVATDEEQPSEEVFNKAHLILSYYKEQGGLHCDNKCIQMKVRQINWKDKLKNNRKFSVLIKLKVDEAPKFKFQFVGFINVSVPLKLEL